jgi:hypothetical protein
LEEHIAFIFRVEEKVEKETVVEAGCKPSSTPKMEAICSTETTVDI